MKKIFITTLLLSLLLSSCANQTEQSTDTTQTTKDNYSPNLVGKWVLTTREFDDKTIKRFNEAPADIILSFDKNGYFEVYDKFNKIKGSDEASYINRRRSGQYMIKDSIITFFYQEKDSSIEDDVIIRSASDKELHLHLKRHNKSISDYFVKK